MNDWKVIPTIVLTTVLIFGAGVFSGGMLVNYVKQSRPHQNAQHNNTNKPSAPASNPAPTNSPGVLPTRQPPQMLTKEFLQRMDTELQLTKDEHEAIQKIITDGQNQMRKVLQDSRLEMREALTPEKRDQFDELMKKPFHKPIFTTNNPAGTPPPAQQSPPPPSSTL